MTGHPEAALLDGCTVLRFDAPLIFANAGTFRDTCSAWPLRDPKPAWIVVAAEPITDVDTTACDMLEELVEKLDQRGVHLVFAELKDPARRKIDRYGLEHVLADDRFYPDDPQRDGRLRRGDRSRLDVRRRASCRHPRHRCPDTACTAARTVVKRASAGSRSCSPSFWRLCSKPLRAGPPRSGCPCRRGPR